MGKNVNREMKNAENCNCYNNNLSVSIEINKINKMRKYRITLFTIIIVLSFAFSACHKDDKHIKGEGPIVSQPFDLPSISGIALSIDANVILTEGDVQEVTIEAQQNIIDN